jgi:hypothetical protein
VDAYQPLMAIGISSWEAWQPSFWCGAGACGKFRWLYPDRPVALRARRQ